MTGKAIVFMGRRRFTLFATMLVVLVVGDSLEMLRWPPAGRNSSTSGHPDAKGITNQRSYITVVYADAQGDWRDRSEDSGMESGRDSASESLVRPPARRGRSPSGRGRRHDDPFHKRYAKELMATAAALVGLLAVAAGYNYFWRAKDEPASNPRTN